jgi:hypothetical protein
MKRLIISIVGLGLATGVVLAFNVPWAEEEAPPVPLPEAYAMATQALGKSTNIFYCVSAGVGKSRSYDGEWLFKFCTTNRDYKYVFVFLDRKTKPQIFDRVLPPT